MQLTLFERTELATHEAVIERGLNTFVDVGQALLAIRDSKLYRNEHSTFEEYCKNRWGMERNYANKMIAAASVVTNLGTIVPIQPMNEAQARPLTRLEPEQQREAWTTAIETAPEGKVTGEHVKRVVDDIIRGGKVEKIVEISAGNKPLETGKLYNVIYADPPWRYDFSSTTNREIENHYPTMTIDEICDLDISKVAASDCVLFMWATSPKLEQAFQVLKSWRFEYKTCAIWAKDKIGMGYYFRQQHELLLIATRGSLPVPEPKNRVSSLIHGTRTEHSKKPDSVYEIIENMYPEYSKIELFSRNKRDRWDAWGNQT